MIRFTDFSRLGSCSPGLASYFPRTFHPDFWHGAGRSEMNLRCGLRALARMTLGLPLQGAGPLIHAYAAPKRY